MARRAAQRAPVPADALLTPDEVMALLGGVSRSFVQDHRAALGARKVGRLLRFSRADVLSFVERGRVADDAAPEPERGTLVHLAGRRGIDTAGLPALNPIDNEPWGF